MTGETRGHRLEPEQPDGNGYAHLRGGTRPRRSPPENVLLILDEAYQEFVSDPAYSGSHVLALEMENVVCVRTFSKAHSLAGFRVSYGIAGQRVADTSSGSVSQLLRQPRRPGGRRSIDARQGG